MMASPPPQPNQGTPVIALLGESLDDEHEVSVFRGVVAGARETGATVLCVVGGAIDASDPDRRARNLVFDVISRENVQGVVVLSSAIGAICGAEALKPWLQRFKALPCCCVGIPVDGYPSVHVDNHSGMRDLTLHLLNEHNALRLAFINGPSRSAECAERLAAFKSALGSQGLECEDAWVVEGDFSKASGAQAVRTLLDERRVKSLDAIVAANDFMALGAMEELAHRGIRVPEEMKVAGFDDIDSARLARPGLTTVRQPAEALGHQGAQLMVRLLSDQKQSSEPTALAILETEVVVRGSCGCLNLEGALGLDTHTRTEHGLEASFVQRRQIILAEVVRASRGTFGLAGAGWESRLLDAFIAELRSGEPGLLNRALHRVLMRVEKSGIDGGVVQDVLSAIRVQSMPSVAADRSARDRLEDAIHDARIFASSFAGQAQVARARALEQVFREFRSAFRARMFGESSDLSGVLAEYLPRLGVDGCLVATLQTPDDVTSGARTLFGFGPSGKFALEEQCELDGLPSHPLLERSGRTLILLPLVFDGHAIGVTILAVRTLNGGILDELMQLFAVTLRARRALAIS